MKVTPTSIPDVLVIEPKVFGDERGFFYESFNQKAFNDATGLKLNFVQDNHSRSERGVLRGLHYQIQQPQGKLGRVVALKMIAERFEGVSKLLQIEAKAVAQLQHPNIVQIFEIGQHGNGKFPHCRC